MLWISRSFIFRIFSFLNGGFVDLVLSLKLIILSDGFFLIFFQFDCLTSNFGLLIWLIWNFLVRCSSKCTPSKICSLFFKTCFLPTYSDVKIFSNIFTLVRNKMISILTVLRQILFALSHWTIWKRLWLIVINMFLYFLKWFIAK